MRSTSIGSRSGMFPRRCPIPVVLLALVTAGTTEAAAQNVNRPNLTISVGIAEYDLSGTGTAGVGALSASIPVTSFFTIDPTLAFLRYEQQFGSNVSILMPEVSVRIQIPGRTVNPYLAVGSGMAAQVAGPSDTDFTVHAAVGTYVWFAGRWAVRPEGRLRSIDPFVGIVADLSVGLSRRL